tara:strand:- start:366 stop:665 length:300 start_codon:yes stop_codon:yes gene_type:complete
MLQISLKQKLSENPNYLNDYAVHVSKSNHIKFNKVSSVIANDFIESDTFVRQNLDDKFKNISKTNKKSKITRLRNHINKLQNELTVSEAIYESLVFSKK